MAYNPQMPQQAQQMPQQGQAQGQPQQWQNPAANWQRTYQNSQWYRPMQQYQPNPYQQQMPYQQMPYQQMPYQQNPYQRQMPQQMPQQFQMPQFSQQQINQFLSYMQSRPMPNFMADPRYQAQQSQKPVYQPPPQPTTRAYVPSVKFLPTQNVMGGTIGGGFTVGDAAADAWVKSKLPTGSARAAALREGNMPQIQELYNQYYAGA